MTGGTSLDVVAEAVARQQAGEGHGREATDVLEYDVLRVVVWSLTRGTEPAHTLRILNCAVDIVCAGRADDGGAVRERLRTRLDDLSEAGDVVALDDGRWTPAPVRTVALGGRGGALLVGGVPTALLPTDLRKDVEAHGAFRRVRTQAIVDALCVPSEPLDAWARVPPEPLESWGRALFGAALPEYEEPQRDQSTFRIYAPEKARQGATQLRRWLDRFGELSGRYLAERARVFGTREYRVVELSRGRIVRSGAILAPGEDRRLRYAADALAHNPTRVRCSAGREDVTITLWSEVPRSEQRLFGALGRLDENEDAYYPRRWRFSHADAALVRQRLVSLAVSIQDS